ncbi:MAG: peptidoglycan-binding protein [Eubacteriales bacterium]
MLILSCVAVAAIITIVSLFAHGNGSSTQQAMAVYETVKNSAPQTFSAPNVAAVSTQSAAPVSSPASSGSSAPDVASVSSVQSAAPDSSPAEADLAEPDPLGSIVFKQGMSDPLIAFIQQRLMDLDYLDEAPLTELYGPLTQQAVMCFQRAAGLPTDGCVGSHAYTILMSENAPQYSVGLGAKGSDVQDITSRLRKLGYLDSSPDTFTEAVKTAVEKFQKTNGLPADGTIGKSTRETLFSDHAKEYTRVSSSQSSSTNVTGSITQKTNLKPAKLEAILPSALKGLGQALYNGEQQYKINSLFLLSIIEYESGNGTSNLAQHQNNLGGLKLPTGGYRTFSTKDECVDYMYNLLRSKYINSGLATISDIGTVYCTGDTWASNVTGIMQDLIAECK